MVIVLIVTVPTVTVLMVTVPMVIVLMVTVPTYLLDVDAFSDLSGYDLWRAKPKDYFSNIVCLGGWLSGSPFDKATLARYGFDRNPYAALASGDERVLLGDPYSLSIKETYLKEHYGVSGSFQEVQPAGPFRPALYRLETP